MTLSHAFYDRPVLEVAPALLGCVVRHGDTAGVIVETEAYHESEPACHAFVGLTARTAPLFGPPGRAYVYRSYGIHALLNAVCESRGRRGCRADPRARAAARGSTTCALAAAWVEDLCSGPGKLTQALGVSWSTTRRDLAAGPVRDRGAAAGLADVEVVVGTRIGITKAPELPWRFCVAGARSVSRPWPPDSAAGFRDPRTRLGASRGAGSPPT